MRKQIAFVTLVFIVLSSGVEAADVSELNSARVPVSDRSDAEFNRGITQALAAVIVKLTGNSAAAKSNAGRAVVQQAKSLVQQFGYERPRNSGSNANDLILRVEFDVRVLGEQMRAHNLIVWGKERPETLVWLVLDDATGRKILGAQDAHEMVLVMKNRALIRGIPLVFPLVDIAETNALADQMSSEMMANAAYTNSEKYGVRSILVGHIRQVAPALWENHWTLWVSGSSVTWEQQGDIVELLMEESTDTLANSLGRRYARAANHGDDSAVVVTVSGLRSAADYARTERYLATLDSVTKLLVRQVDESGITFDLIVQGGLVRLTQSISFGQTLSPDPADPGVFRLNPR